MSKLPRVVFLALVVACALGCEPEEKGKQEATDTTVTKTSWGKGTDVKEEVPAKPQPKASRDAVAQDVLELAKQCALERINPLRDSQRELYARAKDRLDAAAKRVTSDQETYSGFLAEAHKQLDRPAGSDTAPLPRLREDFAKMLDSVPPKDLLEQLAGGTKKYPPGLVGLLPWPFDSIFRNLPDE